MAADKSQRKQSVAIIFGVTGLVGKELAKRLISKPKWRVYGVARRPEIAPIQSCNYRFISCDLLNPSDTLRSLSNLGDVTHVFWVTWASQFPLDSSECCDQNKAMMCNALEAILPNSPSLRHFSLQTGMKHYVSLQNPFNGQQVYYYNEDCPRASAKYNFYYHLEDLLKEKLAGKAGWSVHRPGLLIGSSRRTLYNFMGCLGVYGSICKHLELPFVFGGTRECWEEVCIDGSDAGLVAEQQIWAATNESISLTNGQAFNSINGPSFTWKEIWPALAEKFEVQVPEEMFLQDHWYSKVMADKKEVWRAIVEKEGLVQTEMEDLANWDFLDILFRCPVKLLGTRDKVDRLGFTRQCKTLDSILNCVDCMRHEKLIP